MNRGDVSLLNRFLNDPNSSSGAVSRVLMVWHEYFERVALYAEGFGGCFSEFTHSMQCSAASNPVLCLSAFGKTVISHLPQEDACSIVASLTLLLIYQVKT